MSEPKPRSDSRGGRGIAIAAVIVAVAATVLPAAIGIVNTLDLQLGRTGRWIVAALLIATTVLGLGYGISKVLQDRAAQWSRRARWTIVVGAMAAFAVVLSGLIALRDPFANVIHMDGTQDIASIGFVRPDGSTTAELDELSSTLVQKLGVLLPDSTVRTYTDVTDPPLVGLADGSTAELNQWTADFARSSGAEFVIAGIVDDVSDRQVRIRPAMYVRPSLVREAPELGGWLVGPWGFGVGGLESTHGRASILKAYLNSGVALAAFVDALDAWRVGQVSDAEARLEAIGASDTDALFSTDLVHLFHGHALELRAVRSESTQRAKLLSEAAQEYRQIRRESPVGLRARISLATNAYLQSLGRLCSPDSVDGTSLGEAVSELRILAHEASVPPTPRLAALVNYAQAARCAARAGLASEPVDVTRTLAEIRAFPIVDDDTRPFVESMQALGRSIEAEAAKEGGDTPKAIGLMQEAIALTDEPVDRGRWWGFVSLWQGASCDSAAARESFAQSLDQYRAAVDVGRLSQAFLDRYEKATGDQLAQSEKGCMPS